MGKSWRQDSKNVNWCRAKQQKFHKKQKYHGKSLVIFSSNKSMELADTTRIGGLNDYSYQM